MALFKLRKKGRGEKTKLVTTLKKNNLLQSKGLIHIFAKRDG